MRTPGTLAALLAFAAFAASAQCEYADLTCLHAENSRLSERVRVLEDRLEQMQRQSSPDDPAKPSLPVRVDFRKAYTGPGYVAEFRTIVKQRIPVLVTAYSKQLDANSPRYRIDVPADGFAALGHGEGVTLDYGDELLIENPCCAPVRVTVRP